LAKQGKAINAQGEAREGQDHAEARQELKLHTKTTGCRKLTVAVKCNNRPEIVNMKISNEDGVLVSLSLLQLPILDEPRQMHTKARPRQ